MSSHQSVASVILNRLILAVFLGLVFITTQTRSAWATFTPLTHTVRVTQDSYINAWNPNSNYASSPVNYVRATGQNETQSTILYFNLEDFPTKYEAVQKLSWFLM